MKQFFKILFISSFLIACGGKSESVDDVIKEGDLAKLKAKKTELASQQSALKEQLDRLDTEIDKKDTRKRGSLVTVMTLQDSIFKHYIEVQGNVQTDKNIIIYPEYSGILTEIFVKEGDRVRKGQRLARIDDGGLSSEMTRQKAQTALAKTTFERQKRLWDQKIGSEMSYLEAKTNYESSKAASDQLSSQIGKTVITAPFSGVIDDIIADQGEVAIPGQTQIIRIVNLEDMYVRASVPESFLGKMKVGTAVMIELASLGESYEGKISQVGNFVSPDNRTFDIKVAIPNPDNTVKPNLIATVKINDYTSENAVSIPENVIQQNAVGNSIAYVYEPSTDSTGVAKQVKLESGYSYDDRVEVVSGVKAGDKLIIEGARSLRDGQEVTIKSQNQSQN
ncbi:efflux RND transporter periplasmic adaptor subunit [Flavimarina sp. Hel_I_48]|uniref:efflux RND transporter periplasmic adaptor subunit n=1 Tax=Flavimarina sp. Hel_I_48 TaxID=1392488 RepID=UPI0004DF6BDB|nr:efflux RND transporter periplasmic adaptor subunit [Flavimarina sp. Hel_I_48]